MEKIIKIGKQEVKLNNNISWTMEYRDQFNKDILPTLLPVTASIIESVSTIVANSNGEITAKDVAENLEGRAMEILIPMF